MKYFSVLLGPYQTPCPTLAHLSFSAHFFVIVLHLFGGKKKREREIWLRKTQINLFFE